MSQQRLFHIPQEGPQGFRYKPDFITPEEEKRLLAEFKKVPLHTWNYKGYESKKKVKGFNRERGFPRFFIPILKRVAAFAGVLPSSIEHALIAEYIPGTGIGWHRDNGGYEKVIGISLGSKASFHLRKLPKIYDAKSDKRKWEHFTTTVEPRSIYIMSGESVTHWQHRVTPVPAIRYSLTMRTREK